MYNLGDIILANVQFTDTHEIKTRPAFKNFFILNLSIPYFFKTDFVSTTIQPSTLSLWYVLSSLLLKL